MSASRMIAILTVVVLPLMLVGYMVGRAAPAPDPHQKMKASFEELQKKLPVLAEKWVKKEIIGVSQDRIGWKVKTEIKLARFTGASDAKITLFVRMKVDNEVSQYISFYLRYFNGKWTTIRADCSPKLVEAVGSLMPAIDLAGDK